MINSGAYSNLTDTIAAVTTPHGRGGTGVVRVCGPKALFIADKVFCSPNNIPPSQCASHTIHFGRVVENGSVIDECLLSIMKAPRTYSGQDTVELSLHGGPMPLKLTLACCIRAGARQAGPGEFTYRAFALGKIDLAQAEAVCDLISAKTEAASKASLRVLEGALSEKITAWRNDLISLLMRLETTIDHAGEDFIPITPPQLKAASEALRNGIAMLLQSYAKARHLRCGIRVVICGRPNVGKSSLMNALLERERAIVSNVPGTTRDTIEEHMDICGIEVVITDTAGLRRTSNDAIEAQGFERARKAMGGADVALWVVDGSQPLNSDDNSVGALIRETSLLARTIILVNKNDLPQQINTTPLPAANKIINISCTKASGLDSIGRSIVECVTDAPAGPEIIMVNERHCSALKNADLALSEAENAIAQGATEDLLAFHVREALDYLGEITGATADEEILSKIFSNFCIGK